MEHAIGIDFGTTKTLVSYYDPGSQTNGYVRLGRGIDKMPTSVFVDEDGVWQFGDDADDFMSQYPSRYRRDFKLWLGKDAPYLVAKVKGKIQQYTAKDLVAKFLQNIKVQCEETVFHEPVTSCIVTYPVAFSIAQREELKEAARDAGFEDVQLLPEPEAAGYAYYKFGVDKRLSKMMVVDWGGGTVDFAMVAFDGGAVGLVPDSYGGEENVGGRKFDELLFTHLSRKIEQNGGPCLEDDGDPQLSKHVCNCKEKLSRVAAVKQVMLVGGKGVYRTEVGREEFNGVIAPVVDRVVDQLKGLLAGCVEKPQALLLIGGSSSVPFVRERLEAATGLKCVVWDKLNEAVAIGAAWYGSKQPCPADHISEAGHDQGQPCKCVLVGANTGKTIHADGCADGQLVANLDAGDGKSELFTLIKNDDGSFSLKSDENGKFVSAVPPSHGDCRLVVLGPKIDAWEKFELKRVEKTSDVFTLRSLITGKYVSVDENNGNRLFANRDVADAWEQIRFIVKSAGSKGDATSGVDLALPNVKQRCWKSGTELEAYIHEQKQKHEDYWYFIRSMIAAQWRLNPVLSSALALGEELDKIGENDDSKVITLRVRQGLGAIALGEFDEIVKSVADSVAEFVKETSRPDEVYVELYPGLKALAVETGFSNIDVQTLKNDVSWQLRQLQDVYNDICRKYRMLCDGYARYDKVIAGSSFWKNAILGGALGWLTGGLGVIAAVAWGGWEDMNNKDFVQNYINAMQDFLSTCDTFTTRGQELLSQIVMSKQDLWGRTFLGKEVYLRALNAEGLDLTEVERRVSEKSKQEFKDSQNAIELNQMVALALQLLKQDAPISESRIQKIVEELREGGALLLADGTLDEAALQALVPVDGGAENSAAEFWKIVRRGAGCDEFYIGDCIPKDKLVNALRDYAVGLQPENVLCLFDSTIFGGGGDGFIIAPGGMCWKQLGCDPQACAWNEMRAISAKDRSENGSTVSINGIDVDVPRGHVRKFENMISALRDLMTAKDGTVPTDDPRTTCCPQIEENENLSSLLKRAQEGDVSAMYELGRRAEHGTDFSPDINSARHWYMKAAQGGNAFAVEALQRL